MLADLHSLPPQFVAVADSNQNDVTVACQVSDDATQLQLTAVNSANESFTNIFNEDALGKIKGSSGASDWKAFFGGLQSGFASPNDVTVKVEGGGVVCTVKVGSGSATFTLPKSADTTGTATMLDKFCLYIQLRNEPKPDGMLKDIEKKEGAAKKQLEKLEADKKQYSEAAKAAETEEKTHSTRCDQLQKELNELTAAKAAKGDAGIDSTPEDPDFNNGGLGRTPLGPKDKRDNLDTEMMTLIKSKFQPKSDKDEESAPFLKIIKPLTTSDYETQLKALPENERSIVLGMISKCDDWDFNVFTMQDMTKCGSLFYVMYGLFMRYGFPRKFGIPEDILINFLSQIEGGYHPNPYHNSMHAADVAHIVHFILSPGGLAKTAKLTDEDTFAALIAGMIHDFDHPGINNSYHVKVQSYLAILYNDRSILENHHCAEVFELLKHPRFNVLGSMTEEQQKDIRETIIEMVLSTDMGLHAKIMGNWKRRIAVDNNLHLKKDDQRLALSMAIKMADISNCGRPQHIYLKWTNKLFEEFFLQGDIERNLGNPVSPFMDRRDPGMSKSQVAFMNYIVIPMFESIAEYLPDMHFTVDHCEANKNYWSEESD